MAMPDERHEQPTWEDRAIAAARDDRAAFAPLYDHYAMDVYRYCYRQVRDVDLANDLTSQIFLRVMDKLHLYRPHETRTFRSWLFTVARNVLRDRWRTRRLHHDVDAHRARLPDRSPGPEERAIDRLEADRLLDAVEKLSVRHREIIYLRLAGLTTSEIAEATGATVAAVKSAQSRAYAQLRQDLQSPEDGAR